MYKASIMVLWYYAVLYYLYNDNSQSALAYGLNPMKYSKLYYVTSWPDYPGPARYSSNERGTVSHYNQRFDNIYS